MTEPSDLMKLAIVIVAFIAGYAVVSYVARKLKEGPFHPQNNQAPQGRPTEDRSDLNSDQGPESPRSSQEDRDHPEEKL